MVGCDGPPRCIQARAQDLVLPEFFSSERRLPFVRSEGVVDPLNLLLWILLGSIVAISHLLKLIRLLCEEVSEFLRWWSQFTFWK